MTWIVQLLLWSDILFCILHIKVSAYHSCIESTWVYRDPKIGDICYWFESEDLNASSANQKCTENEGLLAYIPNTEAFSIALDLLNFRSPNSLAYVGYRKTDEGYLQIQSSGYLQSWVPWESGQPSNIDQECIVVGYNLQTFREYDCNNHIAAICSSPYRYGAETTAAILNISTIETTTITTINTTAITLKIKILRTTTSTNDTTGTLTGTSSVMAETASDLPDCLCHCNKTNVPIVIKQITNITEELQTKLNSLKMETMVDEETLSSTIRKRTSATDPRPSSAYVGYLGIAMLSLVFGGIFTVDLLSMILLVK